LLALALARQEPAILEIPYATLSTLKYRELETRAVEMVGDEVN